MEAQHERHQSFRSVQNCRCCRGIGAGAVNQALKAIVIAKGYLAEEGVDIVCDPSFVEVSIDEQERTAIRIVVEPRSQA